MFKKKDIKETPEYKEQIEELQKKDKVQELEIKETQEQEKELTEIQQIALRLTEHEFKAYIISKLEEITQKLERE